MSSIKIEEDTTEWIDEENIQATASTILSTEMDYVEVGLLLLFLISLYRFLRSFCNRGKKDE